MNLLVDGKEAEHFNKKSYCLSNQISSVMHLSLKSASLRTLCTPPFATTLPDLNQLLHGGIPPSTLTEIYGTKSTFKTQFILTLAAQTAINGSPAVILDSDSTTHKVRLVQIVNSLTTRADAVRDALSRIHVVHLSDWSAFTAAVHMLPSFILQLGISFIAIDSMSTIFRTCSESAASKRLEGMAARLRQLAISHCLYVVLTNGARQDDSRSTTSAMGEAWRHSIGTRLLLRRQRHEAGGIIEIIKSGVCPSGQTVSFQVNEQGVTSIKS